MNRTETNQLPPDYFSAEGHNAEPWKRRVQEIVPHGSRLEAITDEGEVIFLGVPAEEAAA